MKSNEKNKKSKSIEASLWPPNLKGMLVPSTFSIYKHNFILSTSWDLDVFLPVQIQIRVNRLMKF